MSTSDCIDCGLSGSTVVLRVTGLEVVAMPVQEFHRLLYQKYNLVEDEDFRIATPEESCSLEIIINPDAISSVDAVVSDLRDIIDHHTEVPDWVGTDGEMSEDEWKSSCTLQLERIDSSGQE